jgi:peptidoglycan/xylan/chitin deacetylase (PgdA/CDA1 family)
VSAVRRREAIAQIDDGAESIRRLTGSVPTLFRPPYGALDPWMSEALVKRGMHLVLWSIEAGDMTHGDPTSMTDSLREQLEYAGGGVVLLHDIRLTTIPVLASLLDWLDAHKWNPARPEALGYQIVDLAQYMSETARSPQPYADRPALEKARAHEHRVHDRERVGLIRASAPGSDEPPLLPL